MFPPLLFKNLVLFDLSKLVCVDKLESLFIDFTLKLDVRSTEPVAVVTLGGGLCPAVDGFQLI